MSEKELCKIAKAMVEDEMTGIKEYAAMIEVAKDARAYSLVPKLIIAQNDEKRHASNLANFISLHCKR